MVTKPKPAEEKVRLTKTPTERAQDALDVCDRKIAAAEKKRDAAKKALEEAEAALTPLAKEREYLAANPYLQTVSPDPVPEPVTDEGPTPAEAAAAEVDPNPEKPERLK